MPIPIQTLEDAAKLHGDASFEKMIDWFALQSEQVKNNSKIVSAQVLGYDHFLHIDKCPPPFFYPMMPRSAGDKEDNTCARITVSPDLLACMVGYNRVLEDSLKGIDPKLEGHHDYQGGYVISKLPFEHALWVGPELVPECANSREHWLVAYSDQTREVHSVPVGLVFVQWCMRTKGGDPITAHVKFYLKVTDPAGLQVTPDKFVGPGHYELGVTWLDQRDPCSIDALKIFLHDLSDEDFEHQRQALAPKLGYPETHYAQESLAQPPAPAPLWHASSYSHEALQEQSGPCTWMAATDSKLRKTAWAATNRRTALAIAFEKELSKHYEVQKLEIKDGKMDLTIKTKPPHPLIPKLFKGGLISSFMVGPAQANHWWQENGNFSKMYEPEPGTLMRSTAWPNSQDVAPDRVFTLEQFLQEERLEFRVHVLEGFSQIGKPQVLYHGSGFRQDELMPGFRRTGKKTSWDGTESNEYLYTSVDAQDAREQAVAGLLEQHFGIDRFQVRGKQVIVTYSGKKPDDFKLRQMSIWLYTIEFRDSDGWIKNDNLSNGLVGEYKTPNAIGQSRIKTTTHESVQDILKDYQVSYVRASAVNQDW